MHKTSLSLKSKQRFKFKVKKLFWRLYALIYYDIFPFIGAISLTIYLWIFFEPFLMSRFTGLEERVIYLYYSLAHSLVILFSLLLYFRLQKKISYITNITRKYGIHYQGYIPKWRDLFLTTFSISLSMFAISIVIFIVNYLNPKIIEKQSELLIGQNLISLLTITYLPFFIVFWGHLRLQFYQNKLETLVKYSIYHEIQRHN